MLSQNAICALKNKVRSSQEKFTAADTFVRMPTSDDNSTTTSSPDSAAPRCADSATPRCADSATPRCAARRRGNATAVAAGILLSRTSGFLRESVFGYYLGVSAAADAFRAAVRIPNFLQNLFGEGLLSATFIPVYARLRADGKDEEARETAHAVGCLLALWVSLIVVVGVSLSPALVSILAPGFDGDKRELTTRLVRIFFPTSGILVLSAWCLGVLNSHRRFLLSYSAPVAWNAIMIGSLLLSPTGASFDELAVLCAWASLAGSIVQCGVQLPSVWKLLEGFRFRLGRGSQSLRKIFTNLPAVLLGRGVIQISAYVDSVLASWLPTGAVAALGYAQTIYLLPISLFGMSISAAELPELSSTQGNEQERRETLEIRLYQGTRRVLFFVIPTAVAFLLIGKSLIAAAFQRGQFSSTDSHLVWLCLAGYSIGLIASCSSRLCSSALYALHQPQAPLRASMVRMGFSTVLALLGIFSAPYWLPGPPILAVGCLTAASGIAAWIELAVLQRKLFDNQIRVQSMAWYGTKLFVIASGSMTIARSLELLPNFATHSTLLQGMVSAGVGGLCYLALCLLCGIPETTQVLARVPMVKRFMPRK